VDTKYIRIHFILKVLYDSSKENAIKLVKRRHRLWMNVRQIRQRHQTSLTEAPKNDLHIRPTTGRHNVLSWY